MLNPAREAEPAEVSTVQGKTDALRLFERFRSANGGPETWSVRDGGDIACLVLQDGSGSGRLCKIESPGVGWLGMSTDGGFGHLGILSDEIIDDEAWDALELCARVASAYFSGRFELVRRGRLLPQPVLRVEVAGGTLDMGRSLFHNIGDRARTIWDHRRWPMSRRFGPE